MNIWARILEIINIIVILFSIIFLFYRNRSSNKIYLFTFLFYFHVIYWDFFRKDSFYHEKDQILYLIILILLIVYTYNVKNWFCYILFFLIFIYFENIEFDFIGVGHVFYFYSASLLVFIWIVVYFWRYIRPKYDLHHLAVLTISTFILSLHYLFTFYLISKTNVWVNNWVFECINIFIAILMLSSIFIFINQYKYERAIEMGR